MNAYWICTFSSFGLHSLLPPFYNLDYTAPQLRVWGFWCSKVLLLAATSAFGLDRRCYFSSTVLPTMSLDYTVYIVWIHILVGLEAYTMLRDKPPLRKRWAPSRHSGDSSLSPNEPRSSLTMMSANSGADHSRMSHDTTVTRLPQNSAFMFCNLHTCTYTCIIL